MSKKQAVWSVESTVAALKKVPGPIKTDEDAALLGAAISALEGATTEKQRKEIAGPGTVELARVVRATLGTRRASEYSDDLMEALRLLAVMGKVAGTEVVIEALGSKALADSYWWTAVLDVIAAGHPVAVPFFGAAAERLPKGFLGVAMLDAANTACREHGLKKHPFDSADGEALLTKMLKSKKPEESSYAVSACAALPFLAPRRRAPLAAVAAKHADSGVRMELAWAQAKLGKSAGVKALAELAKHPHTSAMACDYLTELGLKGKIPAEAKHQDFAAMAAMCHWLAHPNEYGEPPTTIGLFDSRVIYWPPAKKKMRAWLFEYTYGKSAGRKTAESGVGIAGPLLFAMFDETKPHMTPEKLYGLYCELALAWDGDKRAPKKRTGKKGWALIEAAGK